MDLDAKIKEGVVDVCVNMQTLVVTLSKRFLSEMGRHYYVTPTSYLELISTFKNLLNVQRQEVFDAKARYDNGLSKLLETAIQVNEMQVFLEDLQPKLKEATIETDALLVKITADKIVANEQVRYVDIRLSMNTSSHFTPLLTTHLLVTHTFLTFPLVVTMNE